MKDKTKILYIGTSEENINLLKTSSTVIVNIARNMIQAETFLRSGYVIDGILCESLITGGNGFTMNKWVREQTRFHSIPFIMVSHKFDESLIRNAYRISVDDFYVLPLPSVEDLTSRILFLKNFRQKQLQSGKAENNPKPLKLPASKRIFDILVAGTMLILLSPLLVLVGLAIRMESKGKIFYTSRRVGQKPFDFYKLRSMRTGSDAELARIAKEKNQYRTSSSDASIDFSLTCPRCSELPEGKTCSPILHISKHRICDYWYNYQKKEIEKSKSAFIKIADDPRVTRVGKFIRNTSIDELPQLINVLKGDMSIVGNRPLPVYEAERLTSDQISKRFLAPAGLTGLWQVELRGKGGKMSEEERIRLDNTYADYFVGNYYSFWYDLKLIFRTVPALFQTAAV